MGSKRVDKQNTLQTKIMVNDLASWWIFCWPMMPWLHAQISSSAEVLSDVAKPSED